MSNLTKFIIAVIIFGVANFFIMVLVYRCYQIMVGEIADTVVKKLKE